jgi:hypothetical protein
MWAWMFLAVAVLAAEERAMSSLFFSWQFFLPVLWNRIGFNADPDPAFYLNANPDPAFFYLNADPNPAFYLGADPDPDPGSQTNADSDPDPGQTLKSQSWNFTWKIY